MNRIMQPKEKSAPVSRSIIESDSTRILDHYNGVSRREHPAPKVITFSSATNSDITHVEKDRITCLTMVERGYDGQYLYSIKEGGKVFVNDYNEEAKVRETLQHELVHHVRRAGGASSEFDIMDALSPVTLCAMSTLEEGCAVFIQGTCGLNGRDNPQSVIKSVFKVFNSDAITLLPETYRQIRTNGTGISFSREVSNEAISDIVNTHGSISFNENSSFRARLYSAGTCFATIIYAANDFDIVKTEKQLLTLRFDELRYELSEAARKPEVAVAVNEIAKMA